MVRAMKLVVAVVVMLFGSAAHAENVCGLCAGYHQQIAALAKQELAIKDKKSPALRTLVEQSDAIDKKMSAAGCGVKDLLATPDKRDDAGVPTKVAIIHLYMGKFFTTTAGKAFIRTTDAQWKKLIDGTKFYDILQQYDLSHSKITGYFAQSEVFTFGDKLDHDSYSKGAMMKWGEWDSVTREAITSSKLHLDHGGTPIFVLFFPPNVNRETAAGSGKPMSDNGFHGQIKLDKAEHVAPALSLVAIIFSLGADNNVTESHEIYETITNSDHNGWHRPNGGGSEELADVCEHDAHPSYALDGAQIAKIWSNEACGCAP
jgi:hypothetical protein